MSQALAKIEESPSYMQPEFKGLVRKYICPEATDTELGMFAGYCRAKKLDPFAGEVYLIKYGGEKASIVTGKTVFDQRAAGNPQYNGKKAGIVIKTVAGELTYREGAIYFKDEGEKLIGGWAQIFRKDHEHPDRIEVPFDEYAKKTKDGTLVKNWRIMPATMIRKVAVAQALREAFPDELGGLYAEEELCTRDLPEVPVVKESDGGNGKKKPAPAPAPAPAPPAEEEATEAEYTVSDEPTVEETAPPAPAPPIEGTFEL